MDDVDAETLESGGVYCICPICLDKKRAYSECSTQFCCGQTICTSCLMSNAEACRRRSVPPVCVYCRALALDVEGAKLSMMRLG